MLMNLLYTKLNSFIILLIHYDVEEVFGVGLEPWGLNHHPLPFASSPCSTSCAQKSLTLQGVRVTHQFSLRQQWSHPMCYLCLPCQPTPRHRWVLQGRKKKKKSNVSHIGVTRLHFLTKTSGVVTPMKTFAQLQLFYFALKSCHAHTTFMKIIYYTLIKVLNIKHNFLAKINYTKSCNLTRLLPFTYIVLKSCSTMTTYSKWSCAYETQPTYSCKYIFWSILVIFKMLC